MCFQNEDPRFLGLVDSFQHGPLDFVGREAEAFRKRPRFRHIRLHLPRRGQVQRFPRPIDTGGIQGIAAHLFHRDERKIPGIAGDPVRHDEQAGQQDLSRDGQLRQLVHAGKAAFLQGVVKQFPPAALPEFLFPLGPIVGFPATFFFLIAQLVKYVLPGLWFAMVRSCY